MSLRTNLLLATLLAGAVCTSTAQAQSPTMISFQGKLDSSGVPLNGPRTIVFAVYDDSLAGTKLWEETQSAVQVANGLFHVMLGGVTALPPTVFLSPGSRFLAIRVGALDLSPRLRFASVPFALRSGFADGVADSAVTTAKIARGAVTPEKLSFAPLARPLSPGVATSEIADAAVTSAKIADGTIAGVDIAAATIGVDKLSFTPVARPLSPGVATAEIADGAVTSAKIADGTVAGVDIAAATIGVDKLSFTPVARPLSPGVATAEIADGAVTSAKIADGTVGSADLATGAVTSGSILDLSIGTADLATGAVTSAKIADGTIGGVDIATGAVNAATIADEPGGAQSKGDPNALLTLTSAGQSFLSVSLSAPAGGFALVMADVDVFINHATGTFDNVILKVSTSAGDVSTPATTTAIVRVPSEYPAGAVYFVVPVHFSYIFPVAAGSTTFHLNAYESSATGNDRLLNPRILAVYLPSSYGTVAGPTSSAAGTGGSGFDTSLNK